MPDSPSLPAIRERLAKAQAEADRRQWNWPEQPHQQALLRDALALLSLVARLQGERDSLRTALGRAAYFMPNEALPETASEPLPFDYVIVFPNGTGLTQKGRIPFAPTPEHAEAHADRAVRAALGEE